MKKAILLSCITVWLLFSICFPKACQTGETTIIFATELTGDALYEQGFSLNNQEKYQEAIPYFEEAVKRKTNFFEANYQLGICYLKIKQFDKAKQNLIYVKTLSQDKTLKEKTKFLIAEIPKEIEKEKKKQEEKIIRKKNEEYRVGEEEKRLLEKEKRALVKDVSDALKKISTYKIHSLQNAGFGFKVDYFKDGYLVASISGSCTDGHGIYRVSNEVNIYWSFGAEGGVFLEPREEFVYFRITKEQKRDWYPEITILRTVKILKKDLPKEDSFNFPPERSSEPTKLGGLTTWKDKDGTILGIIEPESPEYTSRFGRMKAEQFFEQTSFYQDFNFTVKKELAYKGGELNKFGIKKRIFYTRPNDDSVKILLCVDDEQYVKILGLTFSRTDSQYTIWVKALLNECGINESTCGENYPLDFIQGSVMQNISRSGRLDLSDYFTSYVIECCKDGENYGVFVRKQVIDMGKILYLEGVQSEK
ncbi:MAG: tetratricopeptide repeat protein [Candidatus Omnitrophota bacterium]